MNQSDSRMYWYDLERGSQIRFFNPAISTKIFPQSRVIPVDFIGLSRSRTYVLKSTLQRFQIPSFSVNKWKMMGWKKWYGQNRQVTGSRKMWTTCVITMKGFFTFRFRIPVLYNNISRISQHKTTKSRILFILSSSPFPLKSRVKSQSSNKPNPGSWETYRGPSNAGSNESCVPYRSVPHRYVSLRFIPAVILVISFTASHCGVFRSGVQLQRPSSNVKLYVCRAKTTAFAHLH